jgi:hypothetical protein
MREWKATLTSEKSFSGWIFNSAQPPKGTLGMSARRILASVPHNASPLSPRRQISIACGTSVLLPAAAISCLGAFQPPAVTAVSRSSSPAAEKLHKAQTQRFRAVSSASALYPEHPSVSRPSGPRRTRPVIEAAPNSGYSGYLPSCSVGGRRVR